MTESLRVRKAVEDDAQGIADVMHAVVSERGYSAIDRAWSADEERLYLRSLSAREGIHVAVAASGLIVGCQNLDLYSPVLSAMSHVGQVGTFILPSWRRQGVGQALFGVTRRFASTAGFRKIVITVRASNDSAQSFYRRLGFVECGRLRKQVVIDGLEEDEVLFELFLDRRE
jgi:RimJ/RimL family protein N-acetyltransferase